MLETLLRWNRWGQAKLKAGFKREILSKIIPFTKSKEIVVLTGLRRSGKTTILYQIMDYLESQDIAPEMMLHMNFEEPSLGPHLNIDLLDELYNAYRENINPKRQAYLFFDEIQNIPNWERWVRARNESEDIKIFLTGSSATLMSRELGTLLTGRHISFYVTPLSFKEFLIFNQVKVPNKISNSNPTAEIQHALNTFLQWGGLPEIVLSQNETRKQLLLRQYFDDILFKDVAMRHQVRDVVLLRNLAVHLLTQSSNLISLNRIVNLFGISMELATHYSSYLQEAFVLDFSGFYSLKVAERNRNPRKIYATDLGLRQICTLSHSEDRSKIIETVIFQHLSRLFHKNIFYWKSQQEVDFVIREGITLTNAIQIAYENLDNIALLTRETNALEEIKKHYKKIKTYIITARMPKNPAENIIPLWAFLLTDQWHL